MATGGTDRQEIEIFDPLDYERFRKGEKIETDYVFRR